MNETTQAIKTVLLLNMISGLGPRKILKIAEFYKFSYKAILNADPLELQKVAEIGSNILANLTNNKDLWEKANKEIEKCKYKNINITTILNSDYPEILKMIPDPPPILYYLGDLSKLDINTIAIVGTRKPTRYNSDKSYDIAYKLSIEGIKIVSGLAKGIDAHAHYGALEAGGFPIAVLGSGIDVVYPEENRNLYNNIKEKGIIISEFPVGTSPERFNFPRRNRIISALSSGVLVVEGGTTSGSLITANFALEYGKEVFAFPGPAGDPRFTGTNKLIKQGAKLVETEIDILEELTNILDLSKETKNNIEESYKNNFKQIKKNKEKELFEIDIQKNNSKKETTAIKDYSILNEDEKKIIEVLKDDKKHHIDEIIEKTNFPSSRVMELLIKLELHDFVKVHSGKFYSIFN